jgi:sugar phosphate isomerase/epimerase
VSGRISFSTAALYPRDSEESLRLIARAGFPHAELMPQCMADTRPGFARMSRQIVKVGSIHYPLAFFSMFYNPHPGMVVETRAMNRDIVESAAVFGAETIVIHAHVEGEPSRREIMEKPILDNMLHLAALAGKEGITVGLENNPKTAAGTAERLLAYVKALDHSSILPMVDVTESYEAGIDPADFLAKVNPCHVHLSDHRDREKHVPAGEGAMDWTAIAGAIKAWGFRGLWTLEPAWKHYFGDAEPPLRKARGFAETLAG